MVTRPTMLVPCPLRVLKTAGYSDAKNDVFRDRCRSCGLARGRDRAGGSRRTGGSGRTGDSGVDHGRSGENGRHNRRRDFAGLHVSRCPARSLSRPGSLLPGGGRTIVRRGSLWGRKRRPLCWLTMISVSLRWRRRDRPAINLRRRRQGRYSGRAESLEPTTPGWTGSVPNIAAPWSPGRRHASDQQHLIAAQADVAHGGKGVGPTYLDQHSVSAIVMT